MFLPNYTVRTDICRSVPMEGTLCAVHRNDVMDLGDLTRDQNPLSPLEGKARLMRSAGMSGCTGPISRMDTVSTSRSIASLV